MAEHPSESLQSETPTVTGTENARTQKEPATQNSFMILSEIADGTPKGKHEIA